jgi:hypothetical protein
MKRHYTHDSAVSLIETLRNELNDKYMCELGEFLLNESKTYSDADDSAGDYDEGPKLVFIGGSHAARMAAAMSCWPNQATRSLRRPESRLRSHWLRS